MEKEKLNIKNLEMYMKENFKMVQLLDMEHINGKINVYIQGTLLMA